MFAVVLWRTYEFLSSVLLQHQKQILMDLKYYNTKLNKLQILFWISFDFLWKNYFRIFFIKRSAMIEDFLYKKWQIDILLLKKWFYCDIIFEIVLYRLPLICGYSRKKETYIMKLGIVGLPNVGKSTLFNALTNAGAESANYPFCTIEPNVVPILEIILNIGKTSSAHRVRSS